MNRKSLCLLLILCLCACALCGCGDKGTASPLSFSAANSLEEINALNGKQVTIVGYMATLSPLSGEYMYLMNMPYQSCPFCVPNTSVLSNTMAVYAKSGKSFDFTDRPVRVTGKLMVEDCVDDFGYTYNYRIVDAACEEVDLTHVDDRFVLWQTISQEGLPADVYAMLDYLNFICLWSEWTITFPDENGEMQTEPMWPGDVENYIYDESEFGYYNQAFGTYFDDLIDRCRVIGGEEMDGLIEVITVGKDVNAFALEQLLGGNYLRDEVTGNFTQLGYDALLSRYTEVYNLFNAWMSGFEM